MRLTPIEIRQHRFSTRMRGFDPVEVVAFLEAITGDYEAVTRENSQLRRELEQVHRSFEALRAREGTIQDTLATAQQVVDQLKRTAVKESEMIVSQAELRAEQIVREAEVQRASSSAEIAELRHVRERVEAELRRVLEGYLALIDAYREVREDAPATARAELHAIDSAGS
jgi:cell division initiation protein